MKLFIKNNLKFIMVIVICLIGSSITTLATNYIFNSNEVSYDNTESGLHADEVQGAIDEVFQHATDYSGINTRLTNAENTIGTGSLTTTNKTLISGVNELNNKLTKCRKWNYINRIAFSTALQIPNGATELLIMPHISIYGTSEQIINIYAGHSYQLPAVWIDWMGAFNANISSDRKLTITLAFTAYGTWAYTWTDQVYFDVYYA